MLRWMAMSALFWAEGDSCPTPGPPTRRPRQAPLHSFEHCYTPPRSWLYYSPLFCLLLSHQCRCLYTLLGLHGDGDASDKSCYAKSCKCDWATLTQAVWCPSSQLLALEYPADLKSILLTLQGHALRAAINTPIQGSAADVATAAMLSIARCPELKDMGWTMLLQVSNTPFLSAAQQDLYQTR